MPKKEIIGTISRETFDDAALKLTRDFSEDIHKMMIKAFDALTPEEIRRLGGDKPYVLARAIGMAVVDRVIQNTFAVQSANEILPRLRRILNKRYW